MDQAPNCSDIQNEISLGSTSGWSTSPMKTGWDSWGCSACRRESSGKTLLQPVSTWGL